MRNGTVGHSRLSGLFRIASYTLFVTMLVHLLRIRRYIAQPLTDFDLFTLCDIKLKFRWRFEDEHDGAVREHHYL